MWQLVVLGAGVGVGIGAWENLPTVAHPAWPVFFALVAVLAACSYMAGRTAGQKAGATAVAVASAEATADAVSSSSAAVVVNVGLGEQRAAAVSVDAAATRAVDGLSATSGAVDRLEAFGALPLPAATRDLPGARGLGGMVLASEDALHAEHCNERATAVNLSLQAMIDRGLYEFVADQVSPEDGGTRGEPGGSARPPAVPEGR